VWGGGGARQGVGVDGSEGVKLTIRNAENTRTRIQTYALLFGRN
jgi:hypothetical protein